MVVLCYNSNGSLLSACLIALNNCTVDMIGVLILSGFFVIVVGIVCVCRIMVQLEA